MDEDGYLYLTGRNKDVINRGGEIISPVEIDEALQTHPFVKNCLAFSTPHDLLQETIGVLIVPVPGVPRPGLKALQEYAARSLHSSKWPQQPAKDNHSQGATHQPRQASRPAADQRLDARARSHLRGADGATGHANQDFDQLRAGLSGPERGGERAGPAGPAGNHSLSL